MKNIFIIVLTIALAGIWLSFTAKLDTERAIQAELYEACVIAKYGVNPIMYYDKVGHFPNCK